MDTILFVTNYSSKLAQCSALLSPQHKINVGASLRLGVRVSRRPCVCARVFIHPFVFMSVRLCCCARACVRVRVCVPACVSTRARVYVCEHACTRACVHVCDRAGFRAGQTGQMPRAPHQKGPHTKWSYAIIL